MFNSKTVIVVNGAARAGKDTSIAFMKAALEVLGYSHDEFSSIDPVRNMLRQQGIDVDNKTPEMRALLANVGDQLRDHRTEVCMRRINMFFDGMLVGTTAGVFFLHMREWKLIGKMRRLCSDKHIDLHTVVVHNNRIKPEPGNEADRNVHDEVGDYSVFNNGTLADLAADCVSFVEQNWDKRA
jgi:hypothetical protein